MTRGTAGHMTAPPHPAGRPRPTRRARLGWWLAAGLVGGVAAPARADGPDPVSDRLEWHNALARAAAARAEREAIGNPARAAGPGQSGSKQVIEAVQGPLTDPSGERLRAFTRLAADAEEQGGAAEREWRGVYARRAAYQAHLTEVERRYGFPLTGPAGYWPRPTALDGLLAAWAVVLLAYGAGLAAHEFRVDRRKWRRARGAVAALLLAPAAAGCGGDGGRADRERDRLKAEAADAEAEAARDWKAADEAWRQAVGGWAGLLAADGAGREAAAALADGFQKVEEDTRKQVRRLLVATARAERLTKEAAAERVALPADLKELDGRTAAAGRWSLVYGVARIAAAGLVVAAPFGLLWLARRKRLGQLKAEGRKCPRCLADGRLQVRRVAGTSTHFPETRYLDCQECGYRFRASYAKLPRLCFPTVGVRSSGKTQLLITAYDRVGYSAVPSEAAVQRAPSLGDEVFNAQMEDVLQRHQGPAGTLHDDGQGVKGLPAPINLHVTDADRTGPSTVLVNLFDYSGEMMNKSVDEDALRHRALLMDGFVFFLDPTQLYGDTVYLPDGGEMHNLRLEDQVKALTGFYEDLREARGVEVGRPVPVPIAVCIPKFDLLATENPMRESSVPYIHELLDPDLNPDGPVPLDVLVRRSKVIEGMLPQMFPGLNLTKRLREYFGGRVLYFPVSSVSLIEEELGERDLTRRTIAPYGVVEPILWLLHMHGYQVFAG